MSKQYNRVSSNLRIDLSAHNLTSKTVRYNERGNNITVKTLDERNARFAPSPHRLTNIIYYCNHYSEYEAYLK